MAIAAPTILTAFHSTLGAYRHAQTTPTSNIASVIRFNFILFVLSPLC